ncbi:MAG: serine hydrolase [Gammaproteobacteria bacterium]
MRNAFVFFVLTLLLSYRAAAAAVDACPAPLPEAAPARDTAALDAYIEKGLEDWQLPGLSVAVVQNGRPVYVKGFGVRSLAAPQKVDAETLFGMMSTTKAMTALAVAMLVDEGKLAWDDPVTKHLPGFALSDPFVTRDLRVRDLLKHNSGLGNTDLLWTRGDLDAKQIIARLRDVPLSYSLRAGFSYQNVMYQVAGEVIEAAAGERWEQVIQKRILTPLGMDRSRPTLTEMQAMHDVNVSAAHVEADGRIRGISEWPVDAVPAAGAAWTTADDAAKWLEFLQNDGCADGKRLVSSANFREWLKPQVMVSAEEFYPTAKLTRPHWMTYGYGWFQQDYNGRFVAMHTGSMPGRIAIVGLMPDEHLGIAVFGNLDHAEFRHALMWKLFDVYTGAPPRDWSAELLALYGSIKAEAAVKEAGERKARVAGTRPAHALADYTGRYLSTVYGDVVISLKGKALHIAIGPRAEYAGTLRHWHYERFRVALGDGHDGDTDVAFRTGADGRVTALRLLDESDDTFEFVREPSP